MRISILFLLQATAAVAAVFGNLRATNNATSEVEDDIANIEPRAKWARAKLDQYSGHKCERATRIRKKHDPRPRSCVNIDSATNSIWLSRGAGILFRRKMTAYAMTGCDPTYRIDRIKDGQGGNQVDENCIDVNTMFYGAGGTTASNGRIMSIKFETIWPHEKNKD